MAFTFTVEDGTGLAAANAYVSVSFCNDYHSGRGHSGWSGSTTKKQQAIVRATDYVDKRFGRRFRGTRLYKAQGLEWPRLDAFDNDEFLLNGDDNVPRQLQKAIAEYALRALELINGTGADLVPDGSSGSGEIKRETVKVDVIEETIEYAANSSTRAGQSGLVSDSGIPEYPAADLWIEELLQPTGRRRTRRA